MEIAIIPRFIIRKIFQDDLKQIHANILLSSLLVIIALLIAPIYSANIASMPHFCLFEKVLHIPCPGCGITRSLFSVVRGNLFLAWHYNPAGLLLFFFTLFQIPARITALKYENTSELIFNGSRKISFFLLLSLVLVWMLKLIY
jgi:hypothetical protein